MKVFIKLSIDLELVNFRRINSPKFSLTSRSTISLGFVALSQSYSIVAST